MVVLGRNLGPLDEGLVSLDRQIHDMDQAGIDFRLLSIMPPLFHYQHEQACAWSRWFNDSLMEDIQGAPDRFGVLGTLPMADIDAACRELKRIMGKPVGLRRGNCIQHRGNRAWGMKEWKHSGAPQNRAMPLFSSTRITPSPATDWAGISCATSWGTRWTPRWQHSPCGRIKCLARHPRLKICLSHAGGYFPFAAGRLDRGPPCPQGVLSHCRHALFAVAAFLL